MWESKTFDSWLWIMYFRTLFFLLLWGPSSRKHGATTFWNPWTKNNCISKTMQCVQTGLVLLCCWQPAHSNDINIVGLICNLGCPQQKTAKIYFLIIEGATHSTFSDTLQHPRQLRQQTSGVQQQGLVASRWCKNLAARCFKEGTGNDVRKYMIRSRLSNVSDSHVKLF